MSGHGHAVHLRVRHAWPKTADVARLKSFWTRWGRARCCLPQNGIGCIFGFPSRPPPKQGHSQNRQTHVLFPCPLPRKEGFCGARVWGESGTYQRSQGRDACTILGIKPGTAGTTGSPILSFYHSFQGSFFLETSNAHTHTQKHRQTHAHKRTDTHTQTLRALALVLSKAFCPTDHVARDN